MAPIYKKPDVEALKDLATKLRIHSVTSTNTAGSG